ncbi:fungal-specific transcription factor domain-containing protein [Thelonectria olida]|uniref:Fungal-specific transcription factor domain-containing protein n=1 Tax=Thelonectria olida TaxID=1576542 RepID=A0A9P8VXG5_9HYPO|nr:fungal-specific transcription factor domain-containing protein [Thelonectria olida]
MAAKTVQRRKSSKHDRTGCLTCRYRSVQPTAQPRCEGVPASEENRQYKRQADSATRRKKCVENTFPVCGACTRLNIECIREPVRRIVPPSTRSVRVPDERTQALDQPTKEPSLSRQLSFLPLQSDSLRRRHAMNHYIKVLSELLTVSKHHNSFLSDFLPMAMESPALTEALVAYASGHLSSLDSSYTTISLVARSNALSALSKTIYFPTQQATFTEPTLSACLILLTSEVCLGSHSSWYNHLIGAKYLIESASSQISIDSDLVARGPQALKTTSEGRWVLRNFAFHDIIGSVTLGTKPLLAPGYLEGITDEIDSYLGVASAILVFISQIGCLSWPSVDAEEGNKVPEQYLAIECALKSWQCPDDAAPTLQAVAFAYRSAALVYLYRKMRRYPQTEDCLVEFSRITLQGSIQVEVLNTLENVARVPVDDVSESSLLFPLFIVGGEVMYELQMDMIRCRLQNSLTKRRFRNISRALEVLEELWACRLAQREAYDRQSPDWEDILRNSDEPLLLT